MKHYISLKYPTINGYYQVLTSSGRKLAILKAFALHRKRKKYRARLRAKERKRKIEDFVFSDVLAFIDYEFVYIDGLCVCVRLGKQICSKDVYIVPKRGHY